MNNTHDRVDEVYKLIDEQIASLGRELTPDEARQYAERTKRIEQLVDEICRNGPDEPFSAREIADLFDSDLDTRYPA